MRFVIAFMVVLLVSCGSRDSIGSVAEDGETGETEGARSVAETEAADILFDPFQDFEPGDPDIGREYFLVKNRGRCLTCHTLNGEGERRGWALDDTGLRRDPGWLVTFVTSPRMLRPEVVRMPPFRGDEEATILDVVTFLLTLKTPVAHPEPEDIKPEDEPDTWEHGVGGRLGGHIGGFERAP